MKKAVFFRKLYCISCILLMAAMAFITIGCNDKNPTDEAGDTSNTGSLIAVQKGEGEKTFAFSYTTLDGKETLYSVSTNEETVGAALLKLGLIAGENGAYGLMVTSVEGNTIDTSSQYWAFYVNGEYAMTGVDSTSIEKGATYSLKVETFK